MTITALPVPAPSPTDTPSDFNTRAFQLLGALPQFIAETNATATTLNAASTAATTAANIATARAGDAGLSATSASASASTASAGAGTANAKAAEAVSSAADALSYRNQAANSAAVAAAQSFASGTRLLFHQGWTPFGWTVDVSDGANNRMLRLAPYSGGGGGGYHNPVVNDVVPAHTHGFTTGTESSDHGHPIGDPGHAHSVAWQNGSSLFLQNSGQVAAGGQTGYAATGVFTYGVTANHYHAGSTDNGSSQTAWQPRYTDVIVCQKN